MWYSVERHIVHPFLLTIGQHGETQAVEGRVFVNEGAERLGLDVYLCFHFHRNDTAAMLDEKVNLYARDIGTVVIDRYVKRHQLGEDIQFCKSPFVFSQQSVMHKNLLAVGIGHGSHQPYIEHEELESRHVPIEFYTWSIHLFKRILDAKLHFF